jgi:pimeloyl-ACP methyl ester carboxylesterase
MTVLDNVLRLGRASTAVPAIPAGTLHVPALPKIPQRAKDLWWAVAHATATRMAFMSLWVRRGLGITQPRTLDPALLEAGLTLVLPGIEAESVFTYGMCDGLADGGLPGAIRVFNWGLPFPGGYLANLTRIDRNRWRAADLAAEICRYQDAYPGRPVHLVAQSGGAGIAVFAAEALPAGRMIETIVLLGAALSPRYDVSGALAHVRKGLLNSYSNKDRWVLGLGTRVFGTTDRKFTTAAGSVGFHMPEGLTEAEKRLYEEKLIQLPWQPEMADEGHHWGGHMCCGSEVHLARHIAPWMNTNTNL